MQPNVSGRRMQICCKPAPTASESPSPATLMAFFFNVELSAALFLVSGL
jgi:hypothetical protein